MTLVSGDTHDTTSPRDQQEIADEFLEVMERFANEEHLARSVRGAGRKYYGRFGRDVTDPSAILAVAWRRLVEAGVTLDQIKGKDNPEGWLRRVIEHAAQHVVNRTTDKTRQAPMNASPGGEGMEADPFNQPFVSGKLQENIPTDPQSIIGYEEVVGACSDEVNRILDKVTGERQSAIARLYYAEPFLDAPTIAAELGINTSGVEKALQRGRKTLLPEEVESLTVWRTFNNPQCGTPWSLDVESTLKEVLEGMGYTSGSSPV